jgi:hypothetical protein
MTKRFYLLLAWATITLMGVGLYDWRNIVGARAAEVNRLKESLSRLERVQGNVDWDSQLALANTAEAAWLKNVIRSNSISSLKVQLMESFSNLMLKARARGYDVSLSDAKTPNGRYSIVTTKLSGVFEPNVVYSIMASLDGSTYIRQLESIVIKDGRFELVIKLLCQVDSVDPSVGSLNKLGLSK